jgi:hypothetical protein
MFTGKAKLKTGGPNEEVNTRQNYDYSSIGMTMASSTAKSLKPKEGEEG